MRERPGDVAARTRRYDTMLDGGAADGPVGPLMDAARRTRDLTVASTPTVERGLNVALAEYRATTGRAARPPRPWRRRHARLMRAAGAATLTTKLLVGAATAAAVGGITVVTVEHVRPANPPVHRPARTSVPPSGSRAPSTDDRSSARPSSSSSHQPKPSPSASSSGSPSSSGVTPSSSNTKRPRQHRSTRSTPSIPPSIPPTSPTTSSSTSTSRGSPTSTATTSTAHGRSTASAHPVGAH